MKEKTFKPLKAENDLPDIKTLKYPYIVSTKFDGVRLIIKDNALFSCSLKSVRNIQIQEKFKELIKFSNDKKILLDGEFYAHGIPFQFIVSCFMTIDCFDKKAIKAWDKIQDEHDLYIAREEVLDRLKFYCFDCLEGVDYSSALIPFSRRLDRVFELAVECDLINPVPHQWIKTPEEMQSAFELALSMGYEGLMARNPNGRYKFGKATFNEDIIHKVKLFQDYDNKIIGFVQATQAREGSEKKVNELGRSVTSKKKADRVPIEMASAFIVDHEGKELKVTISEPEEKKVYIWKNQQEFLGKIVQYKGMPTGMKTVPRHCTTQRMREDKDE